MGENPPVVVIVHDVPIEHTISLTQEPVGDVFVGGGQNRWQEPAGVV